MLRRVKSFIRRSGKCPKLYRLTLRRNKSKKTRVPSPATCFALPLEIFAHVAFAVAQKIRRQEGKRSLRALDTSFRRPSLARRNNNVGAQLRGKQHIIYYHIISEFNRDLFALIINWISEIFSSAQTIFHSRSDNESQHPLAHAEMQPERDADVREKSAAVIRKGNFFRLPHSCVRDVSPRSPSAKEKRLTPETILPKPISSPTTNAKRIRS
ncbi:hypothetical protein PUN28_016854 [Cardiocondyla obscurior]|uniref:Uncharacterized protein n=1 Tax=Cardiocondyla obscurior TaxID=286306 RepID=A0AAW2EQ79_9HYME